MDIRVSIHIVYVCVELLRCGMNNISMYWLQSLLGGELFFIADLTHRSGTTSLAKVLAYLEAMEWKVNRLKRCRRHDHLSKW